MKQLFRFNRTYFYFTICLLAIEIFIALFVHDKFIRPYAGDVLVVILMYCFIRTFLRLPYLYTAVAVLVFAFVIEALQYAGMVKLLGLEDSIVARTVLGTSFEWMDGVAYSLGFLIIVFVETKFKRKRNGDARV